MARTTASIAIATLLAAAAAHLGDAVRTAPQHRVHAEWRGGDGPHEVTSLPGFSGSLTSKHFTGYIDVGESNSKHIFYYVVHSEGSVRDDPVMLWLTGGPGCSAMDAYTYENGPFTFNFSEDGRDIILQKNPYSWSKSATVIYVDSPAGTGLSYSENPDTDYRTDDDMTTDDLLTFLQKLMATMPELSKQDFYIAGESYAGVYAPLLASKIVKKNDNAKAVAVEDEVQHWQHLNLKGYLLGNGVTDDIAEKAGQVEFAYGMGLMDPLTYAGLQDECDGDFWHVSPGSECDKLMLAAWDVFYWLNKYDIITECHRQDDPSSLVEPRRSSAHAAEVRRARPAALGHTVACGDRRLSLQWMALPEVRAALHAVPADLVEWQPCSDVLHYKEHAPIYMVNVHRKLLDAGLRALIYSGDHDMIVPFTSTRAWVYGMELEMEAPYAAWMVDRQVAGFVAKFRPGLTFATVKGAGHMVPSSNPREALELISRFLRNEL